MASMWWWLVPQQPPRTRRFGSRPAQLAVLLGELGGVAGVQLGGGVELGVGQRRRVGADAADPCRPRRVRVEHGGEVGGVGAVDHVVGGVAAGGVVDGGDGVTESVAGGQGSVGLDGERDDHRHADIARSEGDADRLGGVGHRDRRDQVGLRVGEGPCLQAVVGPGLLDRHQLCGVVAVTAWPDAAADDHRRVGAFPAMPSTDEQVDGGLVDRAQLLCRVGLAGGPVGRRSPCRRLQHDADAVAHSDGQVGVEVALQRGVTCGLVEQREGGEVGQVEPVVVDQRRLDPSVGEEDGVGQLREAVAVGGHRGLRSVSLGCSFAFVASIRRLVGAARPRSRDRSPWRPAGPRLRAACSTSDPTPPG